MKIVFSTTNTLGGALIRFGTMSNWCHVDLLFNDGILIGATSKGVERMTLRERLLGSYNVTEYRVDEIELPQEDKAREFAEAQVGKKYDFTAVLAFALPWRTNWDEPTRWFCSELVAACVNQGGVTIARKNMWRVSPAFLETSPLLKTIEGAVKVSKQRR